MALWRSSSSHSQDSRQTVVSSMSPSETAVKVVADALHAEKTRVPYVPPQKRRLASRLSDLRRQVRGQLLTHPEEADRWTRGNPEHVATLTSRFDSYVQKQGIELNEAESQELRNCVLDDLLGFGPLEPLI